MDEHECRWIRSPEAADFYCLLGCGERRDINEMDARIEELEGEKTLLMRVVDAAQTIYDATQHWGDKTCPHGNGTSYPTHAWWCDTCWEELEDALYQAKIVQEKALQEGEQEEG